MTEGHNRARTDELTVAEIWKLTFDLDLDLETSTSRPATSIFSRRRATVIMFLATAFLFSKFYSAKNILL